MDIHSIATLPISDENPTGFDAGFEPEYESVLTEIDKLGSATHTTPISWKNIEEQATVILQTKSKDISMATYMAVALQKNQGIQGLCSGVKLLAELFETYWENAFPPLKRLRKRTNAFDWWHEKAYAEIMASLDNQEPVSEDFYNSLCDYLNQLDNFAGEHMPDAIPLHDLRDAVRRIPVQSPKSSQKPPSADSTEKPESYSSDFSSETVTDEVSQTSAKPQPSNTVQHNDFEQKSDAIKEVPLSDTTDKTEITESLHSDTPSLKNEGAALSDKTEVDTPNFEKNQVETRSPDRKVPQESIPRQLSCNGLPPAPPCEYSDETKAVRKEYLNIARKYAFLAHAEALWDPSPWWLLRKALWDNVQALPPNENGTTHVPPPDTQRLEATNRLVTAGKFEQACLDGENIFASSIYCLDVQILLLKALEGLGDNYARAAFTVRSELLSFISRLHGVEKLSFSDGTPFACAETLAILQDMQNDSVINIRSEEPALSANMQAGGNRTEISDSSRFAEVKASAESLASSGNLAGALALLENAQKPSAALSLPLRIHQLKLLCNAKENAVAVALGHKLLDEAEKNDLEKWDSELLKDLLVTAFQALSLAKDPASGSVRDKIAGLFPAVALGLPKN